jgi:hypothetical protein
LERAVEDSFAKKKNNQISMSEKAEILTWNKII